jgi:hypothetical protein
VRRQSVQQEGGTISKEEVCTVRTVLAGMIPEVDFCAFIVAVCYLYSDDFLEIGLLLVGTCGQMKLVGMNF